MSANVSAGAPSPVEAAQADIAVQFVEVSASRGRTRVLRDVSLAVKTGETLALVGRSGSGKTTLLRLVNRLSEPDCGQVIIHGRPAAAWDPIELRRQIGYVIQDAGLFPHMTVASNIALVPRLLMWPADKIAARVDVLLNMVGLDPAEFRRRWPDQLSGGQRQRVGLARALAADPPLLLMDEPFGAVDAITKAELHTEFKRLQGMLHRAVVLVTHDIAEAFRLGDRVAVLHEGQLVACDAPAVVRASTDPRVVALLTSAVALHPANSEGGPAPPNFHENEGGPVPPSACEKEGGPVPPSACEKEGGPVPPKLRRSEGG